jgi:two-component system chemotaxis sensor kinase CheA
MDDFERELKLGFLDEAQQSIADTEQCFLALELNPDDIDNLNKIFRLAHNLKGSSKAVGFVEFGAFTHQFESFILRIKNKELKITHAVVDLLLRANDHILKMISELRQNLEAIFDSTDLLRELQNFSGDFGAEGSAMMEEVKASAVEEFSLPPAAESELSVDELIEANFAAADDLDSAAKSTLNPVVSVENPAKKSELQEIKKPTPGAAKAATAADESIRVGLAKVEELLNYVGEMVILQSVLFEQVKSTESVLLKKTMSQLGKVSKEIQEISLSLRMVPLKPTFQKMQRIVRDTSKELNKEVKFLLQGEDTELDKTVLERINDPLVHLIRNAVDHGIENSETRIRSGKSAQGTITLSARRESGKLAILVEDDGGGMDPAKLRKKAIEKGILSPTAELSDKQAYQLIFAPGFSTKEQVSDVSGRGVGMDVVKTNIQELGGEVQISSELGKGSSFKITLPLTLAIIEAMVIKTSENKFVLPLNHVHETLSPLPSQIAHRLGLGDILNLRGENLPLFRLSDFFGLKSNREVSEMIAIVVRSTEKPMALLVDDIVGQFQVVVKQLGPELSHVRGVSGTTILGDGKPSLILEPQDLVKRPLISGFAPKSGIQKTQIIGDQVA